MNDMSRRYFSSRSSDGKITLGGEIMSGCIGGASQVVFTNPLEIVKIRLQVMGQAAAAAANAAAKDPTANIQPPKKYTAVQIVRQLGLLGLYKGSGACLLRDVPFSGIYFPAYAHLKKDYFGEGVNGKKLAGWEVCACARWFNGARCLLRVLLLEFPRRTSSRQRM